MTLLRLFLVVTLCGAVMTACGSSGSPDDPNSNQGGGGNAGSPDSAGGTGGNDPDPVGGSGGDIGAGGVGGFGGNVGGEGGSMLPEPMACPTEKSDMADTNPCILQGTWQRLGPDGTTMSDNIITVDVTIDNDDTFTVDWTGESLFTGPFTGSELPMIDTYERERYEVDYIDGVFEQRVFRDDQLDGVVQFRRM